MLGIEDLFRGGLWHRQRDEFYLLDLSISQVTDTTLTVRWSMSDACTGQVEYGLSTSLGSSTTEEASYTYSTHVQTITGLASGTPYFLRTKSTSAEGKTVYSGIISAQTSGTVEVSDYGPRPDPPYPVNYVIVPSSIDDSGATDVATAMQTFVDSVPAGSTIVLDQTLGGAGSTYRMSRGILLNSRSDLTFHGYNSTIHITGPANNVQSSGFCIGQSGYCSDIRILGVTVVGDNAYAGTYLAYAGRSGEYAMGVAIYNANGVTVHDCDISYVDGDGIYTTGAYYPDMGSFDFRWNNVGLTGRQGIVFNQGDGFLIQWNRIYDVALQSLDAEDCTSTSAFLRNVTISDNRIERWNWHYTGTQPGGFYRAHAIGCIYLSGPNGSAHVIGSMSDIRVERNLLVDGPAGWAGPIYGTGDPASEDIYFNRASITNPVRIDGLYINDNEWDFLPALAGLNGGIAVSNANVGEVMDNSTQGKSVTVANSTDVTISGNT